VTEEWRNADRDKAGTLGMVLTGGGWRAGRAVSACWPSPSHKYSPRGGGERSSRAGRRPQRPRRRATTQRARSSWRKEHKD
jgi:hypothetical protein